jgi:hypothetical protein
MKCGQHWWEDSVIPDYNFKSDKKKFNSKYVEKVNEEPTLTADLI